VKSPFSVVVYAMAESTIGLYKAELICKISSSSRTGCRLHARLQSPGPTSHRVTGPGVRRPFAGGRCDPATLMAQRTAGV